MITNEMLAQDAVLNGLSDEQKNAIVLMSKNDEETVIGNRFREVYNQLDATIAKETGIARNGDEKTYLYLERAARELAAKANSVDGLNQKVNDLTKEKERLQKALEDSGDETVKKQLAQANKDLASVRQQYDVLKADFDKQKNDHQQELFQMQVDNELKGAQAGLKFKTEFPQAATETLLAQALNTVKGMSPEYIDDGKGGRKLVFKGKDGEIARNPENHLEPYTAAELLKRELKTMGILDEGRQATGGGTKPPVQSGGQGGVAVDVTTARTQTEAQDIIAKQLMQQGLVNGSKEFQNAMDAAWKDNNVSALPVQ